MQVAKHLLRPKRDGSLEASCLRGSVRSPKEARDGSLDASWHHVSIGKGSRDIRSCDCVRILVGEDG